MSIYAPRPTFNSDRDPVYQPPSYELNSSAHYDRDLCRTPSPTPSEIDAVTPFDRSRLLDWRFWFRKELIWRYVIEFFVLAAAIAVTFFHDQIVDALRPAGNWMHNTKGGWVIPIAILIILSIPPLFGHEIVIMLCGIFWGLGVGFAIVTAGTILGELLNFFLFKYWCSGRAEKHQRTSIFHACLAQVIREGGFIVALVVRYSVIPGHLATAIFATCGMGVLIFLAAAVLSLPKQLVLVYLGVILNDESDGSKVSKKEEIAKYAIIAATVVVTMVAQRYVRSNLDRVKPEVIHNRRKARQVNKVPNTVPSTSEFEGTSDNTAYPPRNFSHGPNTDFKPDSSLMYGGAQMAVPRAVDLPV